MKCINIDDFNDKLSSVKVYRTAGGYAEGYWIGSTAAEKFEVTYHIGFEYD